MTETKPKLKLSLKPRTLGLNLADKPNVETKSETKNSPTPPKVPKPPKVVRKPALLTYRLYAKILSYFQDKYPKCFTVPVTPFAIGIHKELMNETDLANLNISRRQLRIFFHFYCSKLEYIAALKPGVQRADLLGNPTSMVIEVRITTEQDSD